MIVHKFIIICNMISVELNTYIIINVHKAISVTARRQETRADEIEQQQQQNRIKASVGARDVHTSDT